jgi:thiosulfate dehydrogenase [quinone] large subunit
MTRRLTYFLTAIAAAIFIFLSWVFADGLFTGDLWNPDDVTNSAIWTYVLLALIVAAGVVQARRLPPEGIELQPVHDVMTPGQVDDPFTWKLLLGNVFFSLIWLPLRFFVGREWLSAGEHKVRDDAWGTGADLQGYWERAVTIPEEGQGRPAITYDWYRDFLQYMLDHEWYTWFADVIAWGEVLVGVGLLIGGLVGIAAFCGTVMNFNFQLAGSASTNPVLFGLSIFLILAWKVAGYWGVDRWLLRQFGTPWMPGRIFELGSTPARVTSAPEPAR